MSIKSRWFFVHLVVVFLVVIRRCSTSNCEERPLSNTILFSTKVQESPIIVIGTSLNKNIDPNVRNLFNVTFRVECILKGRPTQRLIQIVQAGSLLGRRSCQKLNVNRQFIVFLEEFFDGTYRPVDFEEVPYSNQINVVLEKTCGLSRTYPFTEPNDNEGIKTNRCPSAVSIDCPKETSSSTLVTKLLNTKTSTTTPRSSTTNFNQFGSGSGGIDLAMLSQFLAEHPQNNFSLGFLQSQTHKSLFSDDDVRRNISNRSNISFFLFISMILVLIFSF